MRDNIFQALRDARIIKIDEERELFLAWHGGHGVHAYTIDGREVAFWNTGSFAENDASEKSILESMENHIQEGYYPY